jgi:hypothetical protein
LTSTWVLLFPIGLPLLWCILHVHREFLGLRLLSLRGSLIVAFLVFQMLVDLVSEAASFQHHFTLHGLSVAWFVIDAALVVFALRGLHVGWIGIICRRLESIVRGMSLWKGFLAVLAAASFSIFVLVGALYVPTNGDSLVYHLARVAHWVQNGSVRPFATHYTAQIELSPLHEYNMAQLHVLAGTDRLDGFVQLGAVIICVIGASEIARLLGGSRNAQVLAAALTATVPSLILEATSTLNDVFAAAASVGLLVLMLIWRPVDRYLPGAVFIGGALGVAALAKGTLLIFSATTAVALVVPRIIMQVRQTSPARVAMRVAAASAAVVLAASIIAGPFFSRNVEIFGGLTGPTTRSTMSYDLTSNAAAANVIRSTASNFQIGDGSGVEGLISRTVLGGLKKLYDPLHVDPADWHYLIGSYSDAFGRGDYSATQRLEEVGANPWVVVGIVLTFLVFLFKLRSERRFRVPFLMAIGLIVGYILFTASARWSPYGVRYQLPLFVAWCPLMALVLDRVRRSVGVAVVLALVALALPMLLTNVARPVLHPTWSRGKGILPYYHPWTDPALESLAATAQGQSEVADTMIHTSCHTLGLANWISFEYPVWVSLDQHRWSGQIVDVDVKNRSRILSDPSLKPCALLRQMSPGYVSDDNGMTSLPFPALRT